MANEGSKRYGYVVPGITQGFKTFVKLMVSTDPKFTLTGVAITESEEDPGLGAEIQQNYFKRQFIGKTLDTLPKLKVVKKPLPPEYRTVLEINKPAYKALDAKNIQVIKGKHSKGRYIRPYRRDDFKSGRD